MIGRGYIDLPVEGVCLPIHLMKARRFVDNVTAYVTAGRGGNGCVSFRREKFVPRGGPDGGDGGRGGDVYLVGSRDVDSLVRLYYEPHQRAEDGGHGKGKGRHGRDGKPLYIPVPCGTEVWNAVTGERLGDITEHGQRLLVARGGKGGLGNPHWKSPQNRAPTEHTPGQCGESVTLRLELKLLADVGLVGLPNAGKSSLLAALTRAHPRIAAYPFTTLNPVIGTLTLEDFTRITLADIPGLIEGSHAGVGLGDAFLRHIERAAALVWVIDMAGCEGRDPLDDYRVLHRELELYDPAMLGRPRAVVANKMDRPGAHFHLERFRRLTGLHPIPVSATDRTGLDELRRAVIALYRTTRGCPPSPPVGASGSLSGSYPSEANARTDATEVSPDKSITNRSTPNATPAQGGRPRSSA